MPELSRETETRFAKADDVGRTSDDDDEASDMDEFVGAGYHAVSVRVDDTLQIEQIIDTRLRQMQQVACKAIAKPWIKAKEPKKQAKYPYNGGRNKDVASRLFSDRNPGELTKPSWWPPSQGWPNRGCRHKEPDHLKKEGM